jgi:hypothetical protein
VLVTAAHCGFCGRPLPTAQQGAPGAPPAAGQPAKTIMGYALPPNFGQQPPAAGRPPQQPPAPGAPPPQAYGQQPPPPQAFGGAPPQPGYGAPQQPPPGYGAPPQAGYGAPPQAGYGAPPQAGYGAPPQAGYGAPAQPPPQAMPPPQYAQPSAPPPAGGGGAIAQWGSQVPQSPPGTLFGIPFSTLRDQGFLNKILSLSAIALVVKCVLPISFSPFMFAWKYQAFNLLIFPLIAAAAYGVIALPQLRQFQDKIPAGVLKWLPFIVAYLGVGITHAAGGGALGYLYPMLVFGMIAYLQDDDDMVARVFIALGAVGALSLSLGSIGSMFSFAGGVLYGIFGIISFIVLLCCAFCIVYAIPTKFVPKLAMFRPFAPLITAIIALWPFAAVVLGFIAGIGSPISALLGAIHQLILLVAFYVVLMMTAPAAFDILKGWLKKSGVNLSASSYGPKAGGAPAPAAGMTVEQRLAELDAAWSRGGMTPEEYQARRAQIMSGG